MLRDHRLPLLLAGVITLLNALKPAVVDDTAYLLFARHLAADPLQPYGFELYWYLYPQSAMTILLPPVVPYWLAAGIALFGENLALLKLWLFPFAWVLCLAVRSLVRRFAPGAEAEGTIAFSLSPAILPLTSFMLDIPALALGAAAVALFVRGCDGRRVWAVLLAGVCTALAVQTKYSMLAVPPTLFAYALTRLARPRGWVAVVYAVAAVTLAVGLFAAWEGYLVRTHGQSHFLLHLKGSSGGDLWATLTERFSFAPPLLGQFGTLACGVSLAAGAGIGWPRAVRVSVAIGLGLLIGLVCVLPPAWASPFGPKYTLAFITFSLCAMAVMTTLVVGLIRVALRRAADADTLFLLGWLLVEVLGMLGMTPFPAARRVIGVCLATAVLLFHLVVKLRPSVAGRDEAAPGSQTPAPRVGPRWGVAFAVGLGVLVWAIDCWDAYPEKVLAEQAATVAKPAPGEVVWFTGHWGFQYYCERAGMQPLITEWDGRTDATTPMKAGDWLVVPLRPKDGLFYRPDMPEPDPPREGMVLEEVAVLEWWDVLAAQTIPPMYGGGSAPIRAREHPRLRVGVYRVKRDWWP